MLLSIVLFMRLSDPYPLFFPGYEPLPNPTPEDGVVIPLDNPRVTRVPEPLSRA